MPAWKLGVARAQHGLGQGEPPEVERALSTGLLVLDDLGSERNTAINAVPDVIFERARAHFNEQELTALVFTLTTINAWNRLAITMRTEVGKYQPKARPVSQTA